MLSILELTVAVRHARISPLLADKYSTIFAPPLRVNTFSLLSAQFTQSFVAVNWARHFYVCERRIRTLLWQGCVRAKTGSLLGLVHYHAQLPGVENTFYDPPPLVNDIKPIFKCRIEPPDFLSPPSLSSPPPLPQGFSECQSARGKGRKLRISSGVSLSAARKL